MTIHNLSRRLAEEKGKGMLNRMKVGLEENDPRRILLENAQKRLNEKFNSLRRLDEEEKKSKDNLGEQIILKEHDARAKRFPQAVLKKEWTTFNVGGKEIHIGQYKGQPVVAWQGRDRFEANFLDKKRRYFLGRINTSNGNYLHLTKKMPKHAITQVFNNSDVTRHMSRVNLIIDTNEKGKIRVIDTGLIPTIPRKQKPFYER